MDKVAIVATAPNCEAGQGAGTFFFLFIFYFAYVIIYPNVNVSQFGTFNHVRIIEKKEEKNNNKNNCFSNTNCVVR